MFLMARKYIVFFSVLTLFLSLRSHSYAQLEIDREVKVEAGVGDSFLAVSGFISPFASVVMDTKGSFLASTVADREGNFVFRDVRIKDTLENFCLKAIDIKRVGESKTCIRAKPVLGRLEKNGIFLPPTIGLSRRKVTEGESVSVFGYTMPQATSNVNIEGRGYITVTADSQGYYKTKLEDLKRGKYVLYATAKLKEKKSLVPQSRVEVEAISGGAKIVVLIIEFLKWLWRIITTFIFIWIILAILIPIFILIYMLFFAKKRKKKKVKK
ncbi:MAG: hypothetical protein AAB801_02325 [Patescibacteria group bacterium]